MSDIKGIPCPYTPNGAGGDQRTTLGRGLRGIFRATVRRVYVKDGTHRVEFASNKHQKPADAAVLMPFVSEKGLGFLAGIVKGTQCLVVASTLECTYFVVGFFSSNPAAYEGPSVHPGDLHLASSGGAVISAMASGDINIHAHDLCGMSFFQEDQKVSAVDRTFEHKHAGGRLTWGEATEDGSDHGAGDTWQRTEVRRERGKAPTYTHMLGHVPNPGLDEPEIVSRREVLDENGNQLLLEELEDDGTITIQHPNGARFRMQADGDVFVEPKSGKQIYMNDPGKTAKGAARIDDATHGHTHQLTRVGPFAWVAEKATDTIQGGSTVVKIG